MIDFDDCPIWIIDVETTINGQCTPFKSNPFDPDNRIVYFGALAAEESFNGFIYPPKRKYLNDPWVKFFTNKPKMIVGQNIKFDLHYLANTDLREILESDYSIWDIGVVHYLLNGMVPKFPSLDEMSDHYGLPRKPDDVALMWSEGIRTEDIDYDVMCEYLKHDLTTTRTIFNLQFEKVNQQKMLPTVQLEMDALKATFKMEQNGMRINKEHFLFNKTNLEIQLFKTKATFQEHTKMKFGIELDINSALHISAALFGGTVKVTTKEKAGVYKTGSKRGQDKYRNKVEEVTIKGIYDESKASKGKTKNKNIYVADQEVLEKLPKTPLRNLIVDYRHLQKTLSTYYEGYNAWLIVTEDLLHPTYNHAATSTGRLSCTRPNVQNTQ